MNNQSFNPLDPDNIRHEMSDSEKRRFKRNRIYPWYATTTATLVITGFLAFGLQKRPPLPPIPPACEAYPLTGCFEGPPPPPPKVRPLIEPRVPVPEALIHQPPEPLHEEIEPEEWPSVWSCDFPVEEEVVTLAPLEEPDYDSDRLIEPSFDHNGDPLIDLFIFVEEEPRPLNMTEIVSQFQYPQMLRDAEITGFVVVRILVGEEGQYIRHKVINQPHPLWAEEVEKHIPELRFTPAIQDGKAIKFWVNVPFRFEPLD